MPSYQSWRKGLGAEPAPKGIKETVLAARPVATHSVARLMERHGDVKLPDLLATLADCPKARSVSIHDRCKAVLAAVAVND